MAIYISLINFTDQGIRNIKQSPERAQAFRDMVEKAGATVALQRSPVSCRIWGRPAQSDTSSNKPLATRSFRRTPFSETGLLDT